jgi:signal transduction histidine kinase
MMSRTKILVVDDLKESLLALEGLLRRGGLEILTANSGSEALELMITHDFAVALVDVRMPGMDGYELAELMRGTQKTRNIPIIFVTAAAQEWNHSFRGYESGAVDFLLKPLDPHVVKSKVSIFVELFMQKQELKNLVAELRATKTQLELAVKARDEFTAIASHELKNPLTALSMQAQMRMLRLNRHDMSLFSPERLATMFRADEMALKRMSRLVDDMLDVARIASGTLSMQFAQLDLSELVSELTARSADQLAEAGCELRLEIGPSITGRWDRHRIEQVVTNLLSNAMRYGAGGPVTVQVSLEHDKARVLVRNEGEGIPRENQERIFKKFERAESAYKGQGLGLGLYIVKRIVEAHDGAIRVESEPGQGATFIVELPGARRA